MSLVLGERRTYVRMVAERVEAENQAVESLQARLGGGR